MLWAEEVQLIRMLLVALSLAQPVSCPASVNPVQVGQSRRLSSLFIELATKRDDVNPFRFSQCESLCRRNKSDKWRLVKEVPKSMSIDTLLTTLNYTLTSRSSIFICSGTAPSIFSGSLFLVFQCINSIG